MSTSWTRSTRRWKTSSRSICARARPTTAAGRCITAASSTSAPRSRPISRSSCRRCSPDAPHMARARARSCPRRRGALQRLHPHHARVVRPGAVARGAGDAGRDHAAAALVPVPPRQGVVLVAHGDGAAADPDGAASRARAIRGGSRSRSCSSRRPRRSRTTSPIRPAPGGAVSSCARPRGAPARAWFPGRRRQRALRARGGVRHRAPERRGRARRHLPAMANTVDGDRLRWAIPRTIRTLLTRQEGDQQAASSTSGGFRLLPALPLAGLGHGARLPCAAWRPAWRRPRPGRVAALDWLAERQVLEVAGDWADAAARTCGPAAGRSSSRTPTTPTSTTPPWSLCALHRADPERYRRRDRHAASNGCSGMQSRQRRLRRVRCRQHPLLPQRHSVRRSRRAARSADRRRDGALRQRCLRRSAAHGHAAVALERASLICGGSRSRTARGSAAGAPTTSTAPGRCCARSNAAGVRLSRIRRCDARSLAEVASSAPTAAGARATTAIRPERRGEAVASTRSQTAWAMLGADGGGRGRERRGRRAASHYLRAHASARTGCGTRTWYTARRASRACSI